MKDSKKIAKAQKKAMDKAIELGLSKMVKFHDDKRDEDFFRMPCICKEIDEDMEENSNDKGYYKATVMFLANNGQIKSVRAITYNIDERDTILEAIEEKTPLLLQAMKGDDNWFLQLSHLHYADNNLSDDDFDIDMDAIDYVSKEDREESSGTSDKKAIKAEKKAKRIAKEAKAEKKRIKAKKKLAETA